MGLRVDKVSEVLDIPGADIEDPPQVDSSVDNTFILGMGKAKDRVNILLDIAYVVNGAEMADASAISDSSIIENS
jgi:purine-binding chemotaxis protein CheW